MGDHERGKLDDSGFHYDGCAGGLIVVFGGVIGLAELTGIPLENWSTGIILLVMFLLFLLFGVIILLFY